MNLAEIENGDRRRADQGHAAVLGPHAAGRYRQAGLESVARGPAAAGGGAETLGARPEQPFHARVPRHAGVSIAPHGKTTMSPQLFARQLDDGAWAITLATAQQVRVARTYGCARIVLANQLVGRQAIHYALNELKSDPGFDFYCLVDSVENVTELRAAAAEIAPGRPLKLLLEGGYAGGRTGCRDLESALAVARAIKAAAPHLALVGVEGFEGITMARPNRRRTRRWRAMSIRSSPSPKPATRRPVRAGRGAAQRRRLGLLRYRGRPVQAHQSALADAHSDAQRLLSDPRRQDVRRLSSPNCAAAIRRSTRSASRRCRRSKCGRRSNRAPNAKRRS